MNPQISIIVPIYNAEELLPRCLDSIKSQTLENWECALVIDGSTDNSGLICQEYAIEDSRFIPIFKDNGGVSSARNTGLERASGEFIVFIDADDYIEKDYLEHLLTSKADIVLCGFNSSEGLVYNPSSRFYDKKKIGEHLEEIISEYTLFVPWGKLFRSDIIKKNAIKFDCRLRLTEDTMFVYDYLLHCQTLEFIPFELYFYEGKFGGSGKYKICWDEMEYMHYVHIQKRRALVNEFSGNINKVIEICPRFNIVPDILRNHTAEECYSVWKRNILESNNLSKNFFFSNVFMLGNFLLQKAFIDKSVWRSIMMWEKFLDGNVEYISSNNNIYDSFIFISYRKNLLWLVWILIELRNAFKLVKSMIRTPI